MVGSTVHLDLKKPFVGGWDEQRIEQIVTNLISNAIKYAPNGPIYVSTRQIDDRAVLVVQDSGPGIPDALKEKIFDRFEQAKTSRALGGLGLGLYIVKNIVRNKGGNIRVEDAPGSGAKFIVELPLSPARA